MKKHYFPPKELKAETPKAVAVAMERLPKFKKEGSINRCGTKEYDQDRSCNHELVAYLIPRSDHVHLLRHKDLSSGFDIKIEEDSMAAYLIENNPKIVRSKMLVCCDFLEKSSRTEGRNATLMPDCTMICQLLALIFSRSA